MSDHLLAPEDVRRRLEGRLETVEAARAHYQALHGRLEERKWRRQLGENPGLLDEVASREPDFEAALTAIQQRAQREDWPRAHPVLATVREVLQRRDRLDALLDKRLGARPSLDAPSPSRVQRLSRLRALCVRAPVPGLVSEEVLAESPSPTRSVPFPLLLVGLGIFVLSTLFLGVFAGLVAGIVMGLLPAFRLRRSRSTRYWLTPERLVWESAPKELTQVLLRDIPQKGVSAPFPDVVLVSSPHETFVLGVNRDAQRGLLTVLELHRRAPLIGRATPQPLPDVVCFPATFQAGRLRAGCAILRPGFLAFLPEDRLGDVFQAVTGAPPTTGLPLELRHVVEALRHLPTGSEFDACLERAVAQADGVLWRPNAWVRYDTHLPVWKRLHFKNFDVPAQSLSGAVDRRAQDAAERLLAAWPRR